MEIESDPLLPQNLVNTHYDNLAKEYDELYQYDNDYSDSLVDDINLHLAITSDDIFVDLGCGTGNSNS
jgi:ubiquinone/menaquinone biosynthesis C-methylase UbiE